MSDEAGYAYIWEYVVKPDRVEAFEEAYGPRGTWVALFRRAPGYRRTELHRVHGTRDRYLTIDHWDSLEAWQTFRDNHAAEFEALDARCEELTLEERELARLEPRH